MHIKTARVGSIEKSQAFTSAKYDSVVKTLQAVNKKTDMVGKGAEIVKTTDSLADRTNSMEQSMFRVDCTIDEMQKYSRRDCLEITGIPALSDDNPKQLVQVIGSLNDVEINDSHIAAAHLLPDITKAKHRMIVKFVHRDKSEEMYKKRRNLAGKNITHLPTVQEGKGHTAASNNKIHINESPLPAMINYYLGA